MKLPKIEIPKKPHYQPLTSGIDFFELFQKIDRQFDSCFLLESLGEESYLSRYSIIGFDPRAQLSARGDTLSYVERGNKKAESFQVKNPYLALREIVPQHVISRGYAGGLVGYLSYDCVNYFEPALKVKTHDRFDQFRFGVFDDGLVYDKMTGEVFYFSYSEDRSDAIRKVLQGKPAEQQELKVRFLGDTLSRDDHRACVLKVKELIKNGVIFQCEVGFKSRYDISGDTLRIYADLRQQNPSPHMYYVKFGDQKVIGASPELLFRLRQGEMETFPLAGTAKRGKTQEEDRTLARELLNDEKELAEHAMLVDLHRNDLGRVAEFGTVKVRSLMDIKRFSRVQHISSEVVGILRKGEDMFSALASCFPAGTLSGTPKVEAMKIIDQLEPTARGPYGGGLGHFGFDGNCTFAIPIRSLFISGDEAYVQTSGGNVYDSVPEAEYEEIQRKLSAMKEVLDRYQD